jgi:hypothetical protein
VSWRHRTSATARGRLEAQPEGENPTTVTGNALGACTPQLRVGWQPSRFLSDRAEAERAFALAEQLGSVNAAATELGTTWPSLRKAFTRHGLGMPARNPEAVRQRTIEAARQRTGRPATQALTRCSWHSTPAPSPPENGHRLSCMSGPPG